MRSLYFLNYFKIIFILPILSLLIGCQPADLNNDNNNKHQEQINDLYRNYDQTFIQYLDSSIKTTGKKPLILEQLSDKFTIPKKLIVSGRPYDLGYTIGDIARQQRLTVPTRNGSNEKLQKEIIKMYQKLHPNYLEILNGIAKANNLTIEDLDLIRMEYSFFINLWYNLLQYNSFATLTDFGAYGDPNPGNNCSIASYYNPNQQLVGRNFDNPSDRPHYLIESNLKGTYKTLGHCVYVLYNWLADGVNEKGLSMNCATNTGDYFWQEAYPEEPAVFSGHMTRIVLDSCATVDEALQKIGSVRIWFPNEGLHWIISDRSGKSVVVEFNLDRKMVVIDRENPWELLTNTALQEGEDYVWNQCYRYRAAKPYLNAGVKNKKEMFDVMQTMRVTTAGTRTLWTSIMNLNNLTLDVYYFKEYEKKYSFSFQQE